MKASLSRLRRLMQKPVGQVLAATLLFFLVFTVLFAALYRAGSAYHLKQRAVRGGDMTALSCGAVYANGLQWARYSNVVLMAAASYDLFVMARTYVTTSLSGPAAVALALAADPKHRREIQKLQDIVLGVDGGQVSDSTPGVYPCLICAEGYALASDNRMESRLPDQPVFLFNVETSRNVRMFIPHMGLRFRTAADLLSGLGDVEGLEPAYRLRDRSDGQWRYFKIDQVEPAPRANPGQMRVKCDLPSPYRCKYVQKVGEEQEGADLPGIKWALANLRKLLERIELDVTHRDVPPCHTLTVYCRSVPRLPDGRTMGQLSEARLTGEGLAAWDLMNPKFKVRLKSPEPERLPVIHDLIERMPPWLRDVLRDKIGRSGP